MLTRFIVAVTALGAISCIALVDNVGYGTTCQFAGETSVACGKCVAASCQAKVDACCGSKDCNGSGVLGDLDTCGGGGDCSAVLKEASPAEGQALSACIVASCSAECKAAPPGADGGSGSDASSAKVSCSSSELSCQCSAGSVNATECGPADFDAGTRDTLCCGSYGWPTNGICTCQVWVCAPNDPVGCVCGFGLAPTIDFQYAPSDGCDDPGVQSPDQQSGCCISNDKTQCYCAAVSSGSVCEDGYSSIGDCMLGSQINCSLNTSGQDNAYARCR